MERHDCACVWYHAYPDHGIRSIDETLGIKYLWGRTWDPVNNIYGAFPFLLGTLLTSFLALIISIPFSFAIAIYLGEYNPKGWLSNFLKNMVELIAAVPSVIYGFWGLIVLVPMVRSLEIKLGVLPYGIGIFTASLILAIMIIPYAASLGREMIRLVPSSLKEAAYSLGATRYEVIRNVILPLYQIRIVCGNFIIAWKGTGRNHGGDHGDRKYQPDSHQHFCSGEYHGQRNRQ